MALSLREVFEICNIVLAISLRLYFNIFMGIDSAHPRAGWEGRGHDTGFISRLSEVVSRAGRDHGFDRRSFIQRTAIFLFPRRFSSRHEIADRSNLHEAPSRDITIACVPRLISVRLKTDLT